MKLYLGAFFVFFLCLQPLFAQNEQARLLLQSPDGKTVKLLWLPQGRDSRITGFDLKRKEGLQDWVKLNSEPIAPGISTKKKLSIVDADKNEENAVKAQLYKLLATHKLQETDGATLLQKLNSDDKAPGSLLNLLSHDYDIALMSGFAYVDHSVIKKTDYEYGLFMAGTDKLLASASWNYGEIPDLNAVSEITSRPEPGQNGIRLMWHDDSEKADRANVAGFNIYRQGIRLNNTPIAITGNTGTPGFTWTDKSADNTAAIRYCISATSIFGIEGTIKPYTYDPADHPHEYKKTAVTDITPLGYYFKDGIEIKWTFPKDHERFTKGFFVEKNNVPGGYKRVSPLLAVAAHEFIDKSASPVDGYISFRVVAVYNDWTNIPGNERIYNYFPIREPPPPQHVHIVSPVSDKSATVSLTWDPAMPGDTVTDYYRVYVAAPGDSKWLPATEQPVKPNSYTYPIQHDSAAVYKFCISAIGKNKTESAFSDTVAVSVPGLLHPH